jgi:hypothetical protein
MLESTQVNMILNLYPTQVIGYVGSGALTLNLYGTEVTGSVGNESVHLVHQGSQITGLGELVSGG